MARTPASSIVSMSWLTGRLSQSSLHVRKASPRWLWASMTGKRGWSTSCACVVNIGRGSYSRNVRSTVVSLEPTEGYSFYELPLEEEEDDEDGDGSHVRGGQRGPRQRKEDLPIDLERIRPLDRRRLLKVGRNREEILAEQKGTERAEE